MQFSGNNTAHQSAIVSAPLPPLLHIAHNGVVVAQAAFVLLAPFVSLAAGAPTILDRMVDVLFATYLVLIGLNCVFGRPSFRLLAGLVIVGAYGLTGITFAIVNENFSGFIYEAKLLVSLALLFCLLDKRPTVSETSLKILFYSFITAACIFLVFFPGERLHVVNESNYLCLYIGVAMFSYLSWKGKTVTSKTVAGLGVFTLLLIVATQSRTGAGFLVFTWLIYIYERFGFRTTVFSILIMGITGVVGTVVAVVVNAPIVKRFEELKNPGKVDRFIFMQEAAKIVKARPFHENIIRLSYASPVSTRVDGKMKWLTNKGKHGTGIGQLYPHHFHLAYLRILVGHGFLPLAIYLIAIALLWKVNKYLAIGVGVCSLSMSVPYLSIFFGALQIAMAFPTTRRYPQQPEIPLYKPLK